MAREPLEPGETGIIRITQVKPGLWNADAYYCDNLGVKRRVRKSGRSETAARRALVEAVEARLELELPVASQITPATRVREAVEIYLTNRLDDARKGIGRANPRSVKIYRSLAANWIVPSLGELQVRHLTSGRLDYYFRNEVPPSRYPDVRKALHAFTKWLVVQGALKHDPMVNLQSYQRRGLQRRSKEREVTVDDLQAVLAAIDAWRDGKRYGPRPSRVYRDLVLFLAGTACRPGEALALRWRDIEFDHPVGPGAIGPVAHITGTVVYDADQGGLHRQDHTKSNGAGDRAVVLPPFVVNVLHERAREVSPQPGDPVFASRTGGWLSLTNINTRFRDNILKDHPAREWFELRLLRSATGTFVANAHGAEAAAAQMGNTRQIAETHYIHRSPLAPDHSQAIQKAWEGALNADGGTS